MRGIIHVRLLVAAAFFAAAITSCGGKGLPGGLPGGVSDKVPGGIPGGGGGGALDANACGGYASSNAGRKLKAFLMATERLDKVTKETAAIVRTSCTMMGTEIGMTEADFRGETKDICAQVYGRIQDNMKVAFKNKSALKIKYKPAMCTVDPKASIAAAAECEGKANADIEAKCSGACHGTCDGTCAAKNAEGGCAGKCDGTCRGKCEGHADVNASAQCKASAEVDASVNVECTEPELAIDANAKLVVDKSKAESTIKGLLTGLPKILSVKARLKPLQNAVAAWAKAARDLKDAGMSFVSDFKDQATCVGGQIAAAAGMISNIEANVSVSVEVSASASGTIGSN